MIRPYHPSDMGQILDVWLKASIEAHFFMEREFWESKVPDMRSLYIPNSETYVYDEEGTIKGFFSLAGNTLAAMFVTPKEQGRGIGGRLMSKAKQVRNSLNLAVYKENSKSMAFYGKHGFQIVAERIDEHTGHPEVLMVFPTP